MSPLRSSAGPATVRRPTPELLADDLRERRLAEPGRADEEHVVERLAARLRRVERDPELLLDPLLADEVVEPARPQRALELLVLGVEHGCDDAVAHEDSYACPDGAHGAPGDRPSRHAAQRSSASRTRSAAAAPGRRRERLLGLEHGVAELDERVARDEVRRRLLAAGDVATSAVSDDLLLQLEHDPLGRLLADPGDRLEARVVVERDRAAQLGGGRARDDRERDLGPDAADGEQLREELALGRRRRSRRAGARPRARAR